MRHNHTWQAVPEGCAENPGVRSQGKLMIYRERCNCGATKRTTTSVLPTERGSRSVVTSPRGRQYVRDTRNWA